ncbi:MAG: sigma factor [Myxococcales bacterium]
MTDAASAFEAHRPALLALAYRMLGEMAGAEDVVQEAWLRWQRPRGVRRRPRRSSESSRAVVVLTCSPPGALLDRSTM